MYIIDGEITVGSKQTVGSAKQMLGWLCACCFTHYSVLESGNSILEITAVKESNVVVIGGLPIGEPIVQRGIMVHSGNLCEGPFVMNTNEEIKQAIHDYQNGKFNYHY